MKPWIPIIAFAVLGSGIYLLLATRTAERPPAVPTEPAARAPSSIAPAPVARSLPARLTPTAPVEEEPVGAADVHAAAAEDPPPSGSALTFEEMRDHLEESFVAAAPAASRDLAQGFDKRVRAVLPAGSSLRSVECRSSFCRIETMHAGVDEFRDFVQRAFQDQTPISTGPAFVSLLEEPRQGEPVIAVAYVAREGSVLPMPGAVAAASPR
jgi:hypothetical protein